jgi:hypothetical protein
MPEEMRCAGTVVEGLGSPVEPGDREGSLVDGEVPEMVLGVEGNNVRVGPDIPTASDTVVKIRRKPHIVFDNNPFAVADEAEGGNVSTVAPDEGFPVGGHVEDDFKAEVFVQEDRPLAVRVVDDILMQSTA